MDADAALAAVEKVQENIRDRCHINSNEDGDRFVGVKADSDKAMVYFPIGYQLPETDQEIRTDIKHLIQVLSEFTSKQDRVLALNKFAAPQTVDFPINAYRSVMEFYFSLGGKYYVETDPVFRTSPKGNQHWPRTFKDQTPLVQQANGVSSLIYTDFTVRSSTPNDNKLITQINKYCVYEAFQKLGWLYVPYLPEKAGNCPDIKTSKQIVRGKLANTNDDRKRNLFQGMLDMLEYMDEKTSEHTFYFGTDDFDHVWEKLIDKAFGERNKDKYFPRTRWLLDQKKKSKEKHPLMPDSIMIYNGKYYVLDAKCYRFGWTGAPDHLPNASSISKQVTYGEYLERYHVISDDVLFNAFIMPYNMKKNVFGLTEPFGTIGEAVSDWKTNTKYYHRIQGIVIDTRYMMYHYIGNSIKGKAALAECIEKVTTRNSVPPPK